MRPLRCAIARRCEANPWAWAALAIDAAKRERLRQAARSLGRDERPVRIDVVAIELAPDGAVVRHYRNAVTE